MKRIAIIAFAIACGCAAFAGGRKDAAAAAPAAGTSTAAGPASASAPAFEPKTEIGELPGVLSLYGKLDYSDPYRTTVSGLYRQTAKLKDGKGSFLVYISPNNRQAESYVCLVPDSKTDPRELLERYGWKEIADAEGLVLVLLESGGVPWDYAAAAEYLNATYSQSRLRQWYNVQKGNSYLVGYGDGAALAQSWAMRAPTNFASVATFGALPIASDFLAASSGAKSESPTVKNGEIPLPAWLFVEKLGDPEKAVMEYWKTANRADRTQSFRGDDLTELFLAKPDALSTLVDEQDFVAQTRLTIGPDVLAANPDRTRRVWRFLSATTRTGGILNGDLRPAYSLEDWKAVKRTTEIDGVVRHWFEFVPERLHNAEGGKVPLVVAMHGQSTTADAFLWRSEWIKLAAERGFIAIFPAASLSGPDDKTMPRPNWNISRAPACFDDYAFLRKAIEDVSARLPVDRERVYATGQSMGFMTSLAIAIELDDLIVAAAGETGFLLTDKDGGPYYTSEKAQSGGKMPIFAIIGERDMPDFLSEANKKINNGYWIKRNGAGSYDAPFGDYTDGRYRIATWADRNNIPLVQYAFENERPHAPIPSDNTMLYDGFLSKWKRSADGVLFYMGRAVK